MGKAVLGHMHKLDVFICTMYLHTIPLHLSSENRYLLFLTENYAALDILKHYLHVGGEGVDDQVLTSQPYILFGSSFPKDKEYTQVGISYENNTQFILYTNCACGRWWC